MTCSSSGLGIPLPIGGTAFTVSIETLSTAMALITAWIYYDKWKEDKDNLKDLSNRYVAIGEEYCAAADVLRTKTNLYYDYVVALPEYAPTQVPAHQRWHVAASKVAAATKTAYTALAADDVGSRCLVHNEAAKALLLHGAAAHTDGIRYERGLTDKYLASRMQANVKALSVQPPNLAPAFELVGDTVAKSAQSNMLTFNSAMYVAGRGVSHMLGGNQNVGYY